MSLPYDVEFAKEAAPILQHLANAPKPALHDVRTRRTMLGAMTSRELSLPDDVEHVLHSVPAPDGHIVPVYHFRKKLPPREGGEPTIIHIHGGGYIALSAAGCSTPHGASVSQTGVQILSIDYRLAPENPYPLPLDDCWAVLQWVHSNAERLSINPARIAVMGESAGGGLAAALTLLARDRALSPPLAKQILVYPMLDDRTDTNHAGALAFWDEKDNVTGWTAYLGSNIGSDKVIPYAAPARVESVEGLPPLYLDCPQLDIFVHEGLEYAGRFVAANIPTECHIYPGLPHGFEALASGIDVTKRAIGNRYKAMSSF
jgi:acetyl esterase/lipase